MSNRKTLSDNSDVLITLRRALTTVFPRKPRENLAAAAGVSIAHANEIFYRNFHDANFVRVARVVQVEAARLEAAAQRIQSEMAEIIQEQESTHCESSRRTRPGCWPRLPA